MDSGFYSASQALQLAWMPSMGRQQSGQHQHHWLQAQHEFYRTFSSWLQPSLTTPINQAVNQFGILGGASLDLSNGSFAPTGNDTDMALQTPASSPSKRKMVCVTRAREISVSTHSASSSPPRRHVIEASREPLSVPFRSPTVSLPSAQTAPFPLTAPSSPNSRSPTSLPTPPPHGRQLLLRCSDNTAKPAAEVNVRQGSLEGFQQRSRHWAPSNSSKSSALPASWRKPSPFFTTNLTVSPPSSFLLFRNFQEDTSHVSSSLHRRQRHADPGIKSRKRCQ